MKQASSEPTAKPQLEVTLAPDGNASQHPLESTDAAYVTLVQISQDLDLTPAALCKHLEIPERTLRRMRQTKRLEPNERLKVEMVSRVFIRATTALNGEGNASIWMKSSLPVLDFHCPLELLTGIKGYETVKTILGRISSGTY